MQANSKATKYDKVNSPAVPGATSGNSSHIPFCGSSSS